MRLFRPSEQAIRDHLDAQRHRPFTYDAAGATRDARTPEGFNLDRTRRQLGDGEATFRAACDAVRAWRMFPAWTRVLPPPPIAKDETVAVVARVLLWWVNACRIVYVIDEPRRFGFAYGTLPGHVGRGEERFLVEWLDDDTVWYDIRAFSRPGHWAVWLGYPFMRALQHRFGRHSADAMAAHVRISDTTTRAS